MALSRQNVNMIFGVLSNHMLSSYNYECNKQDLNLLVDALKKIVYKVPKQERESTNSYVERVNKLALTEFKRFRLQPEASPENEQPREPANHAPGMMSPPPPTRQSDENQNNDMIRYERDNLLTVKKQMEKQTLELKEANAELQGQVDNLRAKMMDGGTKKEHKIQMILNSKKANNTGADSFIFNMNYRDVYKISLVSGVVECHNDFNIFDSNNNTLVINENDKEYTVVLENGNYGINELTSIIETKLNEQSGDDYVIQYDDVLNRVFFKMDRVFSINESKLSKMLGFFKTRTEKNIYVSDQYPTICKNHSCYVNVKLGDVELSNINSSDEIIDGCFGVLYDQYEKKVFSPTETFSTSLSGVLDIASIELELFSQYKHYTNKDISFELKFDIYLVNQM